jgi:dTDP-4-dehydrorhamnose reductase
MKHKILVTGINGLLGNYLLPLLLRKGYCVMGVGKGPCRLPVKDERFIYTEVDITDALEIRKCISDFSPDYIVHAAAWTQVDQCEINKIGCWNNNVTATRFLLYAAEEIKAHFIYVSTDFVFNGKEGPYGEEDIPEPVNYYGSSKLAAERAVMNYQGSWTIVRTVLVYGLTTMGTRSNLVSWVKDSLEKRNPIRVVDDQFRTPTYAGDLADGIEKIIEQKACGIYHISGQETLTPYGMAQLTASFFNLDLGMIERVNASIFTQPATRPPRTGFRIDKARNVIGYEPHGFLESLSIMYS